jgi:hypothetical protein
MHNIEDALDNGSLTASVYQFSRNIVELLAPWTELERRAVNLADHPADDKQRVNCLELLWGDIYSLPHSEQGRRRLFIGLLAPQEMLNSYSGGMMISFAEMAGLSEKQIESAFGIT